MSSLGCSNNDLLFYLDSVFGQLCLGVQKGTKDFSQMLDGNWAASVGSDLMLIFRLAELVSLFLIRRRIGLAEKGWMPYI